MNVHRYLVPAVLAVALAAPAFAATPQTIVIDGTNDFAAGNLVDNDTGDTQPACDAGTTYPMDLGKIFLTNDSNYLYFGFEYRRYCFSNPKVNLGLAFDVNTAAGGTTDPFGRKIGWSSVPFKPDFIVYDVIPITGGDTFNYEVLYKDNGAGGWPVLHDGSNGLGIADADGGNFIEGRILLSDLGLTTGSTVHFEAWMTQDATTKGPLDAGFGDAVQMSRFTATTFDTAAVVQMPGMYTYTVLNAVDNTPPTVASAVAVSFPLALNMTFTPLTNKVDVTFSEPVDPTTAQNAANYAFSGPSPRTISSAVIDGSSSNLVHLTLNAAIGQNAAFYGITVTGVKDLAAPANTIVANGTTNKGEFSIQAVTFQGDFTLPFCNGQFAATDTFAVEGSQAPLTFAQVADNAIMSDANADQVYLGTVPFSFPRDRVSGKATLPLQWKFSHRPAGDAYEPGSNRVDTLSSDNGATRTLAAAWGNLNPADYTDKAVDVIFKVNAGLPYLPPGRKVWLVGNQAPLTFNRPGVLMKDDGVAPDATAGDKIFTLKVRFPKCSYKNVNWKVTWDSTATDTVYECPGQGDRNVYLNSAAFDTVGGALGAIVLPARGVNRCSVTDKAIAVQYSVNMRYAAVQPTPSDQVAVMGGQQPLTFNLPPGGGQLMADNGVAPDRFASDKIYAKTITYPDSTPFQITYKYWYSNQATNDGFECEGFGDRTFNLDDQANSVAVPVIRKLNIWNACSPDSFALVDVGDDARGLVEFAALGQSWPNPSVRLATIRFELKRGGDVSLRVYDVTGRQVATLVDGRLAAGPHEARWNGRDAAGRPVANGVYLYELAQGGQRLSRRMVLVQ